MTKDDIHAPSLRASTHSQDEGTLTLHRDRKATAVTLTPREECLNVQDDTSGLQGTDSRTVQGLAPHPREGHHQRILPGQDLDVHVTGRLLAVPQVADDSDSKI